MRRNLRCGLSCALLLLFSAISLTSIALGQFRSGPASLAAHNSVLTRYLFAVQPTVRDTVPLTPVSPSSDLSAHKSPFLAAALSLIVPGLGEYYVGDHIWRGMIFTGLEAGLWVGMIHWQNEYNTAQNAFYNYSDAHFCASRYAGRIDTLLAQDSQQYQLKISGCGWRSLRGGQWDSLNHAEALLDSLSTFGSGVPLGDWGHRTIDPNSDLQQFYEEISKYDQFLPGWDYTASWTEASSMRAFAQHEADISRNFLFGIFLNHALSAIDAALLARDHNSDIELHGSLVPTPYPDGTMGMVPTANIQFRF